MKKRLSAMLCIVALMVSFVTIPSFGATGDVFYENVTWNKQTWELKTFEDTSGSVFNSAFVDNNGVLNIVAPEYMGALAADAKYYTATWSPATVSDNGARTYEDALDELKCMDGDDTNRNNDAFDVEFRMRFENKGQVFINWYLGQIRMVLRNENTLMFKTSNEGTYETVAVNMGNIWHDWKFKVRGIHTTVFMDGREIYSYNLFRQPSSARFIQFRTDYEHDYQAKIQVQNVKLTDKRTAEVVLEKPSPYDSSTGKPAVFKSGTPLTIGASAGVKDEFEVAEICVEEDFSSIDIDFNDKAKFVQVTSLDEQYFSVDSKNGYMHYFKSIEGNSGFEQQIKMSASEDEKTATNYMFEYDLMIPDRSEWKWTDNKTDGYIYFDIFKGHSQKPFRQSIRILRERVIIGSSSVWFKNILGTTEIDGKWMSFRHHYGYDDVNNVWKCTVYFKKQNDESWGIVTNPSVSSNTANANYVRFYAYAEDQVEIGIDNLKVHSCENLAENITRTVDFYVNGVKVGSGVDTASTNAGYTLSEGLPAGKHIIKAVSEDVESAETIIYVTDSVTAELSCDEELTYGETTTATVSCSDAKADSVIFFVDGESMGKTTVGEPVSISGLAVGTHTIDAVIYRADGTNINVDEKYINVTATADAAKMAKFNREYRLDYTVAGSGAVTVNDGYFTLDLTHNADGSVTYATIDNERKTVSETYKGLGDGSYRIVATAGNAEVYYNGQLAFSMLMPYTGKADASVNYSGGVSGVSLSGSGVKATRAERTLDKESEVEIYNVDFDKYYSVEFDKNSADDETIMIYDGTYEAVVELGGNGVVVNNQLTTSAPTDKKVLAESTPTGYYRITVGEGMAQLFVDNVVVGTWRCPLNEHRKAVIRHITDPASTTFVAVKNTDDVYYHYEDFDDTNNEDSFSWEDYWYATDIDFYSDHEKNDNEKTNVYREFKYFQDDDSNGKYMSLQNEGEYVLNVNALNPKLCWSGAYQLVTDSDDNEKSGDGFEIRARYMNNGNYVGVRYNYVDKTWSGIVSNPQKIYYDENGDRLGAVDEATGLWVDAPVTGEQPATFATAVYDIGTSNHTFGLEIEDNKILFTIDGQIILESDRLETSHTTEPIVMNDGTSVSYTSRNNHTFGRIAFVTYGGIYKVDDFSYAGEGKAMAGQRSETGLTNADFYRSLNGNIVGGGSDYANPQIISADNGETWHIDYAIETGKGKISPNTINLTSGNVLRIQYKAYQETEDPTSVYTYAMLYAPGNDSEGTAERYYSSRARVEPLHSMYGVPYSGMGSRIVQLKNGEHAGRVIYTRGGSGEEKGQVYMYYSDDYKDAKPVSIPQWHEPNVQLNYDNTGGTVFESQVVEMPDGVVRCYIRSDKGYLSYYESFDGGATWDPSIFHTENLITPSCCYSIKRVGETETYVAFWEYDTVTTDLYYLEHPRNRSAMAISYDGMKTWEYVGDIEERGISASSSTCNHAMTIVDEWIFASYHSTPHRLFIQDINKVKPLKRFSSLHPRTSNYMATTLEEQRTDFCVVPKETGEAYIYGNYIATDANASGFADANVLAKIGGAKVTSADDTGVTITLGESTIRFNDGESGYYMNGSYVNCGVVCCEGKYLDVKVVAELFGKNVSETDEAYLIVDDIPSVSLINQFENIGISQSTEATRIDNLLMDINTASKNGNGAGIDAAFSKYSDLLNVSLNKLMEVEDQSNVFQRLTGIEYRTVADIENAFEKAADAQVKAEGKETAVALSTVSGAFDQWNMLGKNKGTAENADGILTMTVAKGFDETYVYGTPGLDIPKDSYTFTFDYKKVSGEGDTEFRLGNERKLVKFTVGQSAVTVYGTYSKTTDATLEKDKWYTFIGTMENGMLTLKVTDGAEYSKTICEGLEMELNALTRGFWTAMDGNSDAKAQLRNVRVYTGKAIDVITRTTADGKVSATVDFLNDGEAVKDGQFVVGVYNGGTQAGVGAAETTEETIGAFGVKRYSVENVEYATEEGTTPTVKFFVWDGIDTMVPLVEAVGK